MKSQIYYYICKDVMTVTVNALPTVPRIDIT